MELIRISENKIKIMLDAADMAAYHLGEDGLGSDSNAARNAFRHILEDARKKSGFDSCGGRVSVQLYPSRDGGCEMFVTKTIYSEQDSGNFSFGSFPSSKTGTTSEISFRFGENRETTEMYAFETMKWLLTVCRRLSERGFSGESSAYRDENGRYYLFIRSRNPDTALLGEYGSPECEEELRLYIGEHGTPICVSDAVQILGRF